MMCLHVATNGSWDEENAHSLPLKTPQNFDLGHDYFGLLSEFRYEYLQH